jgi:hypothetical protein
MVEIAQIPLSQITPIGAGRITHQREAVLLVTAPGQWHYSAEALFELPGIASGARTVNVRVQVESGRLGIGWLSADESLWITRSMLARTAAPTDVVLTVPGRVRSSEPMAPGCRADPGLRGDASIRGQPNAPESSSGQP